MPCHGLCLDYLANGVGHVTSNDNRCRPAITNDSWRYVIVFIVKHILLRTIAKDTTELGFHACSILTS